MTLCTLRNRRWLLAGLLALKIGCLADEVRPGLEVTQMRLCKAWSNKVKPLVMLVLDYAWVLRYVLDAFGQWQCFMRKKDFLIVDLHGVALL
jgi:hypothetical protein